MHEHRALSTALTLGFLLALTAAAAAHDGDPKILDKRPAYQGPGWRNAWLATAPFSAQGGGSQALVGPGTFQSSNVTLLAWMPLSDFGVGSGGNGNSCYGYTSPSGREYALFGHSDGTAIVEVTQPANPQIVAQIAGPQSLWRDIRAYGPYAYAVSEGGSGIQVINLTQVDSGIVTLAGTITTGGSTATHTVEINQASGRLYRAGGGGNGLRIYDLAANPVNPPYIGSWPARYVHEAQIVTYPTGGPGGGPRELAICCGGLNNGYGDTGIDIVDVTNAALPVHLAHITYPTPSYSHQACLSPDRQYLFHNDEIDGLPHTRVFNAANLNAATPTLPYIGYFVNGVTVDHNIYTRGTWVIESNYRSGLRVFDTSTGVTTPTLVGWFDTYPEDDASGYNGLWNNYPYFASQIVIGSDIERGFFVWWVGTPPITFAWPNGAPTTLNPAGETRVVQVLQGTPGAMQPGSAKLWWSTGGSFTPVDLVHLGGDDYSATFPAFACGTTVEYYASATGTSGIVWTDVAGAPDTTHLAAASFGATVVTSATFETSSAGFARDTLSDTATAGLWTRANPNGTAEQPEDDHTAAGSVCWFTGQGTTTSVGEADVDGGRTTLLSALYDVSAFAAPVVGYWRWYVNDGNAAVDDSFRVDVSSNGGASWVNVETLGPGHAEASGGWFRHDFNVADFVPLTSQLRVRFVAEDLGTGSIVEAAIDDFEITEQICSGYATFCSGDGTNTDCPCGNAGASGSGCANSTGQSGAMTPGGTAAVSADTLDLAVSGLPPTVSVLFFQGTQAQAGGQGVPFGDGLRCVAGSIVRLGTKITSAGASDYPQAGDASISVRGGVAGGDTRYYQAWYRNAAAFCTGDTFNLTNGVSVVWAN